MHETTVQVLVTLRALQRSLDEEGDDAFDAASLAHDVAIRQWEDAGYPDAPAAEATDG